MFTRADLELFTESIGNFKDLKEKSESTT
jgi:hypothetical protein